MKLKFESNLHIGIKNALTSFNPLFFIIVMLIFFLITPNSSIFGDELFEADLNSCIFLNKEMKTITVKCKNSNLNEVYRSISNENFLKKESDKIWVLKSNLIIDKGVSFSINSTDTNWLKISSDKNNIFGLYSYGNLNIDSVKITSWNENTQNYSITDGIIPRSFIITGPSSTGPLNIQNSEICCLGYHKGGEVGLVYMTGSDGSVIKNNNFQNMWYAFYSHSVGGILIEDNHFYNNHKYAIDPHSGSHDLIIRNNLVNDTKGIGIICSEDCYNILIEDNILNRNERISIMLSRNNTNSIVTNNTISDSRVGIWVDAKNNEISNNVIENSTSGIIIGKKPIPEDLERDYTTSYNVIKNNIIIDSRNGIILREGAFKNNVFDNLIKNSNYGIRVNGTSTSDNIINKNIIEDSQHSIILENNNSSKVLGNEIKGGKLYSYLVINNSRLVIEETTYNSDIIKSEGMDNFLAISNSGIIDVNSKKQNFKNPINTDLNSFTIKLFPDEELVIDKSNLINFYPEDLIVIIVLFITSIPIIFGYRFYKKNRKLNKF